MCWSYEEEVRIVKCIKESENKDFELNIFNTMVINGKPMYLFKLPKNSIKSVYLGARSKYLNKPEFDELYLRVKKLQPNVELYGCKVSNETWALEQYNPSKHS